MDKGWVNDVTKAERESGNERCWVWDREIGKDGLCVDLVRDEMDSICTAE